MTNQLLFNTIKEQGYFDKHKRVLIAVSGGVDSMNLLHFLHYYRHELAIDIAIAHVNHKQRKQSDEEEAYLRRWASDRAIPFYLATFSGAFTEAKARAFRYEFFEKIMRNYGYTALTTAHHKDDQAETIFMRILRGSRLRHLVAMQPVIDFANGQLIRPFLTIAKSDLPEVFHFDDQTNHKQDYLRNRVRLTYLPQLYEENPKLVNHLTDLSQEVALFLEAIKDLSSDIDVQDKRQLREQTPAVRFVLIQDYLQDFPNLQLTKPQFNWLVSLAVEESSGDFYLKSGYYFHATRERFWIDKISPRSDGLFEPKRLEYGDTVTLGSKTFTFGNQGAISLYSLSPLILRPRQSGDVIDFGTFHKKVRRLFIDEKIPKHLRDKAIIGEQDGSIVFVSVGDDLYLSKPSHCVTIRAKLCIKTKEIGDL